MAVKKARKLAATFRDEISTKELAAFCELTERRVQQLAGEGVFKKTGHGKYKLKGAGAAYKDHCVQSEIARRIGDLTSKTQYDVERARKLKLANDKEEALLIETPDAIAAIDFIFGEVLASLAGIAPRLTDDISERRRIEAVIDSTFANLADKLDEAGTALRAGEDPLEAGGANIA